MASNRELREEAEALAAKVGVSVETSGLGRSKLTQLIKDLEARLAAPPPTEEPPTPPISDTETSGAAEESADAAPPEAAPETAESTPAEQGPARYVVAPRVSFCCSKRGTIRPGQSIGERDFGDPEAFWRQVAAGKIRKV